MASTSTPVRSSGEQKPGAKKKRKKKKKKTEEPAATGMPFETTMAFVGQAFWAAAMGLTLAVWLPKFYTDEILIPAGLVAVAVAVARAFDAITDPLMGYISDHTKSRWGRRKPWIAVGVAGYCVTFYLLLVPPDGTGRGMMNWYGVSFMLLFVFVTMVAVPRAALAVELTHDANERTSLFGSIALLVALGLIAGAMLPGCAKGWGVGDERNVMQTVAVVCVVGYAFTNWWFLKQVPERKDYLTRGTTAFVPGVRRALRSRPFRVMFVSHLITGVPLAIPATLMPYFVQYVMKSEEATQWTGWLVLTYLVSGFFFLPFWVWLARRIGRLKVWLTVSFIGVTGGIAWMFIGPGDEYLALALEVYVGSQAAVWFFLGGAMHADIVDYDELMTGKRREAQFSAYWTIIPKFSMVLGASIPLAIMAMVGYVPNQEQTPEVSTTIRILFAAVPAVLNAVGLSVMWWYPLSEKAHSQIRAGIEKHAKGEPAIDPITERVVPPLEKRSVEDETGWRLDYFSAGELERVLEKGPERLLNEALASMAGSAALAVAFAAYAISEIRSLDEDPGVLASLAVVGSGLGLTGAIFHALRIKAAIGMRKDPVPEPVIRAHLEAL